MIKPQHELLNYHTLPVQAPGRSSNHRCRSWVISVGQRRTLQLCTSEMHQKRTSRRTRSVNLNAIPACYALSARDKLAD